MRNKNIKKKIMCLFLSAMLGIEPCFAAGIRFTSIKQGGNNNQEEKDPYTQKEWQTYESGGKTYQYRYKYDINSSTTISVNAYNLDGTSVIPKKTTINRDDFTFKAGTWVGINVSEHKSALWKIKDLKYEEVLNQYNYICEYQQKKKEESKVDITTEAKCDTKKDSSYEAWLDGWGICKWTDIINIKNGPTTKKPFNNKTSDFKCPKEHPNYKYYELINGTPEPTAVPNNTTVPENIKKEMKELAIKEITAKAEAIVKNTSGSVQYMTNNSYPKKHEDTTYGYIYNGKEVKKPNQEEPKPKEKDGVITGSITKQFEFLVSQVCMNLKNSKVSYGRDCQTTDGEIAIANGTVYDKHLKENVNYWHYFIPLNTKSDSEFSLDIIKNESQNFDKDTCENFMKENSTNYQDLIIPSGDNGTFIGDYGRYEDKSLSTDLKTLNTAGGCNISTKIKFPISQEFYNEVSKTTAQNNTELKLQGFNFYYKPININNPFPNGLGINSLWQSVNKNTIDLSKSFANKTYETTKINSNQIREYNKEHHYTSWDNMYTTGVSSFIENEKIVTRLVDNDSFYQLGCGPANENQYLDAAKKVTNIKYIERCDAS